MTFCAFPLKQWHHVLAAGAMLALLTSTATAAGESWPKQPITLLVPYAPGGNVDAMARWVAPEMSSRLGQAVLIENLAGAGGVIGTEKVVRAKPDGYTLLLSVESTIVIAKMVTPSTVRYDGLTDLTPVTLLGSQPLALVAKPSLPERNAAELYSAMKSSPGKFSYATSGVGTSLHLGGEMLKQAGDVGMVHVPYKNGAQIVTDLTGNQMDLAVLPVSMVMQQAKKGLVKVLGVLADKPSPALPDVPPLGTDVPAWKNANVSVWQGVFAPKGTPAEVIAKINAALQETLKQPAVQKNFKDSGVTIVGLGPDEFASFLIDEKKKFGAIVTKGQIRAE